MAKEIKESQNQVDPARKLYLSFIFLGLAGLVTVIGLLFHMMNANRISRFPEPGAQSSSGASRVVYRDDRHLLILVPRHGAPDAPFQLQSLDVHTGLVKWTAVVGEEQPDKALPLNGGFVVAGRFSTSYIDSTGRVVSEYKIK